jgi:hypothetical protein
VQPAPCAGLAIATCSLAVNAHVQTRAEQNALEQGPRDKTRYRLEYGGTFLGFTPPLHFQPAGVYTFKMAGLDPKVASVIDRATRDDDSDEDALIASLEDDSELDAFREQRLQQLHAEFDRARRLKANEHGTYTEIKDEKALMDITTSTKLCVVHFFKPDFNRCRIMDTHLEVGFHLFSTRNDLTRDSLLHNLTTKLAY